MRGILLIGMFALLLAAIFPVAAGAGEALRAEGLLSVAAESVPVADAGYPDGYPGETALVPAEEQFPTPDEVAEHPFGDDREILVSFKDLFQLPLPGIPMMMSAPPAPCGCTCNCPCDCPCSCHSVCGTCGNDPCTCPKCPQCHAKPPCVKLPCGHWPCLETPCGCAKCDVCGDWGKPSGTPARYHPVRAACHNNRRTCQPSCGCCGCLGEHDYETVPAAPSYHYEGNVYLSPNGKRKIKVGTEMTFTASNNLSVAIDTHGWTLKKELPLDPQADEKTVGYTWSVDGEKHDGGNTYTHYFGEYGRSGVSVAYGGIYQ